MVFNDEQLTGAAWVLEQALGAAAGTSALVIHDEATTATAKCFSKTAQSRKIRLKTLLVPTKDQEEYSRRPDQLLEPWIREQIDKVNRIVVLQAWGHEVAPFRFGVLRYGTQARGNRVASMPGVSLETLHLCSGNLDHLTALCRLHADRLIWSSEVVLETGDGQDGRASLVIPIGVYTPSTSTGRVPLWGWCNVPSGETFIVPDPKKVHGSVFINGSIPNFPIPAGHWLRLDVSDGRVRAPIACSDHPALRAAADRFLFDRRGPGSGGELHRRFRARHRSEPRDRHVHRNPNL